jgi:hypothetical protein
MVYLWKDEEFDSQKEKTLPDETTEKPIINQIPKSKESQTKTKSIKPNATIKTLSNTKTRTELLKSVSFEKIDQVTVEDVIAFVFPAGQARPRTAVRLWTLADQISHLAKISSTNEIRLIAGNNKSSYLKPDYELKTILDQTEQEFYKQVYYNERLRMIDDKMFSELKAYANPAVKEALSYSKDDIIDLLTKSSLVRMKNETNNMYYHRIITQDYRNRVQELKRTLPNLSKFDRSNSQHQICLAAMNLYLKESRVKFSELTIGTAKEFIKIIYKEYGKSDSIQQGVVIGKSLPECKDSIKLFVTKIWKRKYEIPFNPIDENVTES